MLLANIPIVVFTGGKRRILPVGAEVPADLPAHDIKALLASGAVTDAEAAVKTQAAAIAEQKQADAQYQAARQAVQAAAASVAPQPQGKDESANAAAGKPKAPAKKTGK